MSVDDLPEITLEDALWRIIQYYAIDKGQGAAGVVGKVLLPDTLPDATP